MSSMTDTKKVEDVDVLVAVGKSLDALSALLISQRKDVERRLIDLKVESSIYEDEIRNAIGTGQRYLNELHDQEEFGPDEVDNFISTFSKSSQELGEYVDTVSKRIVLLEKNKQLEGTLEEMRHSLTEAIDNLETTKPLLANKVIEPDESKLDSLRPGRHSTLGSSAIIRSQEMERQQIAREIHDGPAQAIANVVLRFDIVKKIFEQNPETIPGEIEKMKGIAQSALNEIRGFIFDLRPMTLQDLGLAATIKRVIHSINDQVSTGVQFIQEGDERELDPDIKLAIFRIAQESLNNMRKHSEAESCWVHLKYLDDKVILLVEDDGVGYDKSNVEDSMRKYYSFGILGMRERADDIGASLNIKSVPGSGTKVILVVMTEKIEG